MSASATPGVIELDRLMGAFGGGGHGKAASATLKNVSGIDVFQALCDYLELSLRPALTAADIMTSAVDQVLETASLLEAALLLEEVGHTGCPVTTEDGSLTGLITLRDIMKARRAGQMHAPVKGYMSRDVVTATPLTTVRQIEDTLLFHNIGHLPVVDGRRVVGIVTRTDYLNVRQNEKALADAVREKLL